MRNLFSGRVNFEFELELFAGDDEVKSFLGNFGSCYSTSTVQYYVQHYNAVVVYCQLVTVVYLAALLLLAS